MTKHKGEAKKLKPAKRLTTLIDEGLNRAIKEPPQKKMECGILPVSAETVEAIRQQAKKEIISELERWAKNRKLTSPSALFEAKIRIKDLLSKLKEMK